VGGAQREIKAELVGVVLQIGEGSPGDDASHGMAHHVDDYVPLFLDKPIQVRLYLVCQLLAHDLDVPCGICLVAGSTEEHGNWQHTKQLPTNNLHVVAAGLETMNQDHKHVALFPLALLPAHALL